MYRELVDEQNEANDVDEYDDSLTFETVREKILKNQMGIQEMQRILRQLDTNFDARISYDEFQAAMVASQAEQDDAVLRSSFNRLDVNGDKYLTVEEIKNVLTGNQDALHRIR